MGMKLQAALEEMTQTRDSRLSDAVADELPKLRKLVKVDPGLPVVRLILLAARRGPVEIDIKFEERQLVVRVAGLLNIPNLEEELREIFWFSAAMECQKSRVAIAQDGQLTALFWNGFEVFANSQSFSEGALGTTVELCCSFEHLKSPLLSLYADKEMLDKILVTLNQRCRYYPEEIRVNSILWTWPLEFDTVRSCFFTSYTLEKDPNRGFAVAHPWAHGCRFFVEKDGSVVDLYSRSGEDAKNAKGNFCHIPALSSAVSRRLGLLKKVGEAGIDISMPRTWGRNSYFPGGDEYLLSTRNVVFGSPPVKLQMRPLRVSSLFLQEDRDTAQTLIHPIRRGFALDTLRMARKPGGMVVIAECPEDLPTSPDGFKLLDGEAKDRWVESIIEEFQTRHNLIH